MALEKTFAVVGGGAAGFFAALNAKLKNPSLHVVILEATPRLLTKVKISGGGRCNVTHHCFEVAELVKNYPRGFRELRGPFNQFGPQDTIDWFAKRGVKLHVEKDGRMFPTSNSSQTIINCFLDLAKDAGVEIRKSTMVKSIRKEGDIFHLDLGKQGQLESHYLMLATGSAPLGHKLAKSLGHKIVDLVPSLFTFNIEDPMLKDLSGLSFAKASLKLKVGKKTFLQEGPLLITHWGLSGPAVLKLSAFAARELFEAEYQATLRVNFVEKTEDEVFDDLLKLKESAGSKEVQNQGFEGLTKRFWQQIVTLEDLQGKPWNQVPNKSIRRISQRLSGCELAISGKGEFKEEFVSCGGIKLKELNFKTMESKIVEGLYFAGEILNIDGITGGFNFQNAWTGGWICSSSVAQKSDS